MPRISTFYVIVISMYWRERDHPIPHFHAEYARQRASIAVDGTVLAGTLPARALRLVREWAAIHDDELVANWNRAREHERLAPSIPFPSIIFVDDLPPLVHIADVEVIGDHERRLTFEDGLVGDVAFEEDE